MTSETDAQTEGFRRDARSWLAANFPPSLAFKNPVPYQNDAAYAEADPDHRLWRDRLAAQGWGAPDWPTEYGGAGLGAAATKVLAEEMARIGAFNPMRMTGMTMLGPTLLEFGDAEQKARHLAHIARGERRWCQGFSEPGAGSDLAALSTRCLDMGDHWQVTGQKIWTSGANHADWCFALVRTDTTRKQGGISFLLIDMKSPGVQARPIVLISGSTHFCEVFFDDVEVPKANLVGEINQGWGIAKRLLQFERDSLSEGRSAATSLLPLARERVGTDAAGRIADPDLRMRLVGHAMRARAFDLTVQRKARDASRIDETVPVVKNLGSVVGQERFALVVEMLGQDGLGWEGEPYAADDLDATRQWLHSHAYSIYGGSFEIQNNIAAKRVLGLPDSARPPPA